MAFPSDELIAWYRSNKRILPWRETSDPYLIWLSEIMLQQTRVDQAKPYYLRFTKAFPNVKTLANTSQEQVLKEWEGLGYYSRARNLHEAAKTVEFELSGKFPDNYEHLLNLKGIGPYTAAAISSIAFNEKRAVVDGNVMRVICRYVGIEDDIRSQKIQNQIQDYVSTHIPENAPGDFNQAVMELGATVCTPHNPSCSDCPLQTDCFAAKSAKTDIIPYKSPAKKSPHYNIVVGVISDENNNVLIAKRPENTMLGGLWEFPGGKVETGETNEIALQREILEELGVKVSYPKELHILKHTYSHLKITLHAYTCKIVEGIPKPNSSSEIKWVKKQELLNYPFPKANRTLTKVVMSQPTFE